MTGRRSCPRSRLQRTFGWFDTLKMVSKLRMHCSETCFAATNKCHSAGLYCLLLRSTQT
jgi:hypothetical protein